MADNLTYSQQRAKQLTNLTRMELKELPPICADFLRAIEPITMPLTRYAYACDLRLFFNYLKQENPLFADKPAYAISVSDIEKLTSRDISLYLDYLTLYYRVNTEITNGELGKMRKLSSLRSFYEYLFKNMLISGDVSKLVDMPKRHEKPILRMDINEVEKMLDIVENGEDMPLRQKKYNDHTRARDLAILTLFLGTGIRVSELVGINIDDIDFDLNAFTVTRKGGNQAMLYFPDEVADVLKQYLSLRETIQPLPGNEDALFLSLQLKRMSVRAIQIMVKKYATLAAPLKKRLSPHKLRSTFGTNLYHETGDIYLVADVLGHTDVNTTRRHYAAMTEDRRKMAAQHIKLRETPVKHPKEDE